MKYTIKYFRLNNKDILVKNINTAVNTYWNYIKYYGPYG